MMETERELLGVYFADPSLIGRDLERYFKTPWCREVYGGMIDLLEAGETINVVTVAEHLYHGLPGSTSRLAELISYPAYTKQKWLDREAADCLYRMRAAHVRAEVAVRCRDPLYQVEDILADLKGIKGRREVFLGKTVEDGIAALVDDLGKVESVKCGFAAIDDMVGGFRKGELVAFMARPAIGKTFVLLNIVHALRGDPVRVSFFSLEMPLSGITERLIQIHDGMRWRTIGLDYLRLNDHSKFKEAYQNLSIHSRPYSVAEIGRLAEDEKADVVFIDFLGLIKPAREYKSPYERVSQAFLELKTMAKEKSVVVFLAVQLSRAGGDGTIPVKMDAARDSGQVEELSDFIVGCWRPKLYSESWEERRALVMALEKNKRGDVVARTYHLTPTGLIVEAAGD